MDVQTRTEAGPMGDSAKAERISDRELVVSRTINGSAGTVFKAWTDAELLKQWWAPKSFPITLLSCETDPRVGGRYKLVFGFEGSTMEFFGRYLEVTPPTRLAWTNDEAEEPGPVTTVTFADEGGKTQVVVHELYPSTEALDAAIASGSAGIDAMPEQLAQLEELLATLQPDPI